MSKRRVNIGKGPDIQLPRPQYDFHASTVVFALCIAAYVTTLLVGLLVFKIHFVKMMIYSLLYYGVGLGLTFVYYRNKNFRIENKQKINLQLGNKALSTYYLRSPTWVRMSDREKCEWLNNILEQVWPYYDKAICDSIIENVGPTLNDYAFPPVKSLAIEQLRFGDSPIRFENVKTITEEKSFHVLEMEVRWKGDSKIVLGIDTFGLGQITPKITNITFVGVITIILRPLLPVLPGFGAVVATFKRPPIVKYQLNFGKLGGSATASQVKPVIDSIIRNQLTNLVVWPNRYITPILPEEVTGNLDYLKVNTVGILKVRVVRGIDLKQMDRQGATDGFLEMFTQPENISKTQTIRNNLNPTWNEDHWHLVQEPSNQFLKVTCYDLDFLNLQQMTKHGLNIFKGMSESVNAKEFLGRVAINLAPVCKDPGIPYHHYFPLGVQDWSNPDGCGAGRGQLQMELTYQRLVDNDPARGSKGALIVTVKAGEVQRISQNRTNKDEAPNAYVKIDCSKKRYQTPPQNTKTPKWDQTYTWFQVDNSDKVEIQLFDDDGLIDDCLGKRVFSIVDIINSTGRDRDENTMRGLLEQRVGFGDNCFLDVKMKFVSYY